ncbi:MAG: 3-phosphoshikimate 1-carboxyvinyltransferase [Bacteroidales bacterium]|nr:3-phosphoshikimate 1-carboxyvinyltransferase [Bacteroidales bacterium]
MGLELNKHFFSGIFEAPASKSHEQRILAAVLLSQAICIIENVGASDDVLAAREIISKLGSDCSFEDGKLVISPNIDNKEKIKSNIVLNCRESAMCARLFTPIACLFAKEFTVTAKGSLLRRSIVDSFEVLKEMGCKYESKDGNLPVYFEKSFLKSGHYSIDAKGSSQFISGLIMSLALIDGDSNLIIINPVSINYILMTISVLKEFGIDINYSFNFNDNLVIDIPGNQTYKATRNYKIEGDWSGIANICVAAAVNGKIGVKGLYKNSLQADRDILKVFDLAGVNYYWENDVLIVEKSDIKAFDFNATDCPDLIPSITILAAFANGESHIYGASRLKFKESSRAEVLQIELTKANLKINIKADDIQIIGNGNYSFAEFDSHDDHRIAMALAVFGMLSENGAMLKNYNCVSKSYPNFFNDLKEITGNNN